MPTDGPRLLVVLSRYPANLRYGSAILMRHTLPALARRFDMHLVCRGPHPAEHPLAPCFRVSEFLGRHQSLVPKPLQRPLTALMGLPSVDAGLRGPHVRARVDSLWATGRYAAVLAYDQVTAQYLSPAVAARSVVCIEDAQSIRLERLAALEVHTAWERFRLRAAARQMRRYERRILPPLGRVLLLSGADTREMQERDGHRNLGVVAYPGALPPRDGPGPPRVEGRVVFSGNMDHPGNLDGALWLLDAILPRLLEAHPAATLRIVGARPHPRLVAAAARFGDRVVVTGMVPDVSEEVIRARVAVCPVRVAVGVQTKVVEALSLGTPVVSTGAGNRGVAAVPGESIAIADDPDAFAAGIAALLRGERWESLSGAGRRFVAERFSPARSAADLEGHLDAVRRPDGAAGPERGGPAVG